MVPGARCTHVGKSLWTGEQWVAIVQYNRHLRGVWAVLFWLICNATPSSILVTPIAPNWRKARGIYSSVLYSFTKAGEEERA